MPHATGAAVAKKKKPKNKKECLGKNLLGSGGDVGGPELLLVLVN